MFRIKNVTEVFKELGVEPQCIVFLEEELKAPYGENHSSVLDAPLSPPR